jgi:hypothetical protein
VNYGTQKLLELDEGDRFANGRGGTANDRLLCDRESGIAEGFAPS